MDNIILYSTHCPLCMVLEKKLKEKNIEYVEINDINEMSKLGFTSVPVLKVNDEYMNFFNAKKWIEEK